MKFNLYILTVVAFSIAFGFYFFNQNPYDMGDSIVHYGISKYSWEHHELFLDHWGKPIFTILSSPFSQFGFSGMAAFNTLVGVLTVIVTALIIEKLDLSISPYVAILLLFIPEYTLALHSGLTEPLYGLFVVIAFYLILMQQYTWSVVVVSFLPYVRSEGFITLTVILVYLIVIKKYQSIIWAVLGSVVLAVLGAVLLKDNLLISIS